MKKQRPECVFLLIFFMVLREAKFAVQSCTEPAENSKNLKKWLGTRIYPSAATATPATGRGKKWRKKPILASRLSFPYLHEYIYLFFWPKKMMGVIPWKLVWNMKLLDTMQPHMTGNSLQAKLKQEGLNQSNTSCDYSSLCSNKSWR